MDDKKQHSSFAKSIRFAMRGLLAAVKGERNFRMQLCAFVAVVALGFLLHLTALEWVAVVLGIYPVDRTLWGLPLTMAIYCGNISAWLI